MNPFFHALLASVENEIELKSLLQDHSYSWWSHPSNVYHNGVNYFTSVGINRSQDIHRYENGNIETVVVNTGLATDEHNRPSFLIRETDIFVVIHTRNSPNFYTRTVSFDFQTVGALNDISSQVGFVSGNYSQVFQFGSRILIFTREEGVNWAATWSDDGINWTAGKKIFSKSGTINTPNEYLYMSGHKNGDKIIFGLVAHPNSGSANSINIVEIDGVTGELTGAGVVLGNIYDSGFTAIDKSTLTPIFQPNTGNKIRLLDVSVSATKINILLSHFPDTSNGNYIFKQVNRSDLSNSQEIPIIDHGYDTYTTYFGGAYFVKNDNAEWNNTIYLARNENDIWTVEEWQFDGTTFLKVQEIDSLPAGAEGLSLTRPEPPINSALGGLKIIYQKGDYNESFTWWDNEIIGIV